MPLINLLLSRYLICFYLTLSAMRINKKARNCSLLFVLAVDIFGGLVITAALFRNVGVHNARLGGLEFA